nr:uncharacterized protein K02A2.6-like [Pocillopora verrucosa]
MPDTEGGETSDTPPQPAPSSIVEPKTLEVRGLPCFDPKGEPTTLSVRWKRWKRAFHLYVASKGITNQAQKVALLLHSGGMELQEIFYTLAPEDEAQNNFDNCVAILDKYFTPKVNVPFERHGFRQMAQLQSETIDQFVCRLRQKAVSCELDKVYEAIRDQLIEKGRDPELRKKFLEKAQDGTLTVLQDVARVHESVILQMQSLKISSKDDQVNAVRPVNPKWRKNKMKKKKKPDKKDVRPGEHQKCYRCNETGHFAHSCPALNKTCNKCGFTGHLAVCCKTKNPKRPPSGRHNPNVNGAYQVEEGSDQRDAYAFAVNDRNKTSGIIHLKVGGVELKDVLIDSGASCNLVNKATWESLKQQGVKCKSQKCSKKLFAYGQTEPIEVLGTFEAEIYCEDSAKSCLDEFTVVKGPGKTLLGKYTAEKLNVLRVGPPSTPLACTITSEGDAGYVLKDFADIFQGVGKLKDFQLKLHINKNVKPVAQPVRRLPFGLRDKVDKKLDELLQEDIIEEVPCGPTEWTSPLVVVPKPDGDIRICVDMRRANGAIERERHPIPTIEEVLHDLNGSTVFSKLDLRWGFHQIELDEESRQITTFVTHRGLYRYKRLMFGITSAPEKYQKIVSDVLQGCEGVANIADDVIVHGCGIEQHDKNLLAVLDRLRQCGLTLNPNKCQFRLPKLTFFGHDLSKSGVTPSEEKVAAVQNAKPPKNVAEVRSFLGLVQYCAKFLPNFAQEAEPIRQLTRKDEPFVWKEVQQQSFEKLKYLLTRAETLAYFKNDCKTRIVADAGPTGIGAVLTQFQDGVWRVISYASRNLTDVERRYSQTEKEALALVWACERFNLYVYGRDFELETDHKPLECIYKNTSKPFARIERWVLRLQSYNFQVVYRPGKTNIADALSRLNSLDQKDRSGEETDAVKMIAEESTPVVLTAKEVERASEEDPELTSVRHYIQSGDWSQSKMPHFLCVKNELCVLGKLVLRGTRIVIPQSLRKQVLHLAHEGHQGIVKMKSRLRTKVWWPKMDTDAERICKSCHGCQVVSGFCTPEAMQRVEPPTGPWQDVAIDVLGPLPSGESSLVVVDYYSRFFEVVIMRSTTSQKMIEALTPIFVRYGYPFTLKSDNAAQFVSEEFKEFLSKNGIEHRKSPPLWPQANGEVERQNRTLLKVLKIAQVEGKRWKDELNKFLLAYRTTPHSTTGMTPASLMFGRELKTKLPELRPNKSLLDESIRDQDWNHKLSSKLYADKQRNATFNPGDKVLLKNTKSPGKLAPKFEPQPYTVQTKEGQELTLKADNGTLYRRNSSFVKPYNTPGEPESSPPEQSSREANPPSPAPAMPESSTTSSTAETRSRPTRATKLPGRFKDFVLDK